MISDTSLGSLPLTPLPSRWVLWDSSPAPRPAILKLFLLWSGSCGLGLIHGRSCLTAGWFHLTTLIPACATVRVTNSPRLPLPYHHVSLTEMAASSEGAWLPICHSAQHSLLSPTRLASLTDYPPRGSQGDPGSQWFLSLRQLDCHASHLCCILQLQSFFLNEEFILVAPCHLWDLSFPHQGSNSSLEELILLKWPNQSYQDSLQSLSKYQWYFPQS